MATNSTTPPSLKSGIYCITCVPTGKRYVGSAVNIKARWNGHRRDFSKRNGRLSRLHHAWLKYGYDALTWEILEYVEPARLIEREQYWIDFYDSANRHHGLNTSPTAGSTLGAKLEPRSKEVRARMSKAIRERTLSPEAKANIAAGARYKRTPEVLKKYSEAQRGKKRTEEQKAKLRGRPAHNRGKPMTEEQKAKLSEAARNRSPETRARMSAAQIGKKRSPESRAKIAAASRGRKHTPEELAKMSASQKGRVFSDETRAKMSESRRKSPLVAEHIAKLADKRRGQKMSPESIAKNSAGQRERYRRAREAKQALASANGKLTQGKLFD